MSNKKYILNLLIAAEVVILIIVVVGSLLFGNGIALLGGSDESSSSVSTEVTTGSEDNAISSGAASQSAETDTDSGDTDSEESGETVTTGSSDQDVEAKLKFSDEVEAKLDEMTTEEKVAQLFVTTPEALTGVDEVNVAGDSTKAALGTYPVAGLIYSSQNFVGAEQVATMIETTQGYIQDVIGLSLFTIVEEVGGENHSPLATGIARDYVDSPASLGEEASLDTIYSTAQTKAAYVLESGFNTVLAPVADTATGSDESFDEMTYGSDTINVSECIEMDVKGTQDTEVMAIVRAFPGINAATEDYTAYQVAIDAGADCIQVSNIVASAITGSSALPCSLSEEVADTLRDEMGFDGLLMTSDLSSSAVQEYSSSSEAAVLAVNAGMDLIYITDGFEEAYQAVLDAVNDGTISNTRLTNSVGRVLSQKMD